MAGCIAINYGYTYQYTATWDSMLNGRAFSPGLGRFPSSSGRF